MEDTKVAITIPLHSEQLLFSTSSGTINTCSKHDWDEEEQKESPTHHINELGQFQSHILDLSAGSGVVALTSDGALYPLIRSS
ncbi:hypothetical protein TNIN_432061 [Trichonephila inaurata madagascariensis]|uniref:Uncharacterized protein n=1 Tax=Trichonephila inaurata madagascariensis TaxID=2747483 RepID=A0A8X6XW82_9ARAC|nr:hypothetical protein TNIN_432061 [Trichonephila inaurata madagascariensis]